MIQSTLTLSRYFQFSFFAMAATALLNGCGGGENTPDNGSPQLEPRVTISASVLDNKATYSSATAGDVNNDGFDDVVAVGLGGELSVFINDKKGLLKPLASSGQILKRFNCLVDLNQDGNLDLLILTGENWFAVYGEGGGTFAEPQSFENVLPGSYTRVSFGFLNDDEMLDMVGTHNRGVTLFLALGDNSYANTVLSDIPGVSHVADFNDDGFADVLISSDRQLFLYVGNGDGTFKSPQISHTEVALSGRVYLHDLNGDGWLDIAYMPSGALHVLTYEAENGFKPSFHLSHLNEADYDVDTFYLDSFTVADMNCDGAEDLVLAEFVSGTVKVLLNNADTTFRKAIELDPNKTLRKVVGIDVDVDGVQDLFALPGGEVYKNLACQPR